VTQILQHPTPSSSPMLPSMVRVHSIRRETHDTFTLVLDPPEGRPFAFLPGQFNMLYGFGLGEVAISLSGDPAEATHLIHTIRAVGSVTRGLARLGIDDKIGVRGPFGSSWPMEDSRGSDVVVVTGGIGLAPLRPALYHLLRHRTDYARVFLLYGARTPADVLYRSDLQRWRERGDIEVLLTVDRGDPSWRESVGLVTTLMDRAGFRPDRTIGMICGPEVMMKFTIAEFENRGVSAERLYITMERNMQCAVGFCGHCQFGPNFVCMDGPVFRYDRIRSFFEVREA
jgi:NAD(P)H-flavin reductase